MSKGDEIPSAPDDRNDMPCVERPVDARVRLDPRVLAVDVIDMLCAKSANCRDRVAPHPDEMRRIEIHTHGRSHGVAQTQVAVGIIDALTAVIFDAEADSLCVCERSELLPERNHPFRPL